MAYPGILTRGEFATGLITRGIKINGNYLLVDSCNINQSQQIDTSEKFLQGGPGSSVSDIGAKKITGDISFPIRVDDNGTCLVSGCSPSIFKSVMSTKSYDPMSTVYETVNVERYNRIVV